MKLYDMLTVFEYGTVRINELHDGNAVFVGDVHEAKKDDDVWEYLFCNVLGCGYSDKNEFVINIYKNRE